ncbi:MAG TPA: peptidylprolyl isomerase [Bryobacteraceae bacterium]|nr:peptidylprolyl isomerase [Bryobacteraceae bacterium]
MKVLCVAALAFAPVCLAADNPTPHFTVVDQIVAKVNGDIVSQDELQRLSREIAQELRAQGENGEQLQHDYQAREKNVLRDRIDELLLIQKGKELNINVDSEVSKYMANLQRQSGITDQDKFHDYIRQQSGMSYEDFLNETKNQFLTRQVIGEEVGRHINITDKEVADYYNAHKKDFIRDEKVYLSEILISTEGKDAAGIAAAQKKAEQLASDAAKGERFSDLARDNSDATTAKDGGVLGAYKKGDLSKVFEEAVWNLPKGGVTKPIRIPTGFEILKVDDHTKAGLESLADAKPEIENILYGPKMQPKIREYLTQLREQAFLQIKPGFTDTGAAPGQDTKWQDPAQLKPETVTKAEVEQKMRHKKLLWVIPIPGTQTEVTGKSSSR